MSTLMSPWSGRNTAVMNMVNVGVCVFFLGTQSVEARDNRPGLELGSCECICNSNALDGQGEPQFSEPRAYDLPTTSDRCSAMTGAFCWVHTGHGVKEGELHVCLWTNSAYSQTPARPGLRPQQPASTASPLTAFATVVLRETAACTPIHDGFPETSAENLAAGPPRACPPILDVHALGCTTCHPGATLGFEVHIKNFGGPVLVELKTGARLPDGSTVTILERHEEETIPPGVTVIPLFAGLVLPAGIPAGTYAIEAALIEPALGVTLSRSSVPLTLMP